MLQLRSQHIVQSDGDNTAVETRPGTRRLGELELCRADAACPAASGQQFGAKPPDLIQTAASYSRARVSPQDALFCRKKWDSSFVLTLLRL
jgi:hypothetical protein